MQQRVYGRRTRLQAPGTSRVVHPGCRAGFGPKAHWVRACSVAGLLPVLALAQPPLRDTVPIVNRTLLKADRIECERIPLGEPDDYKPCIARLPDGELLLTAFHQYPQPGNKVREQSLLFRSRDGGRSWTGPEQLNLLGREPYLTVTRNGTLFLTGHLLARDVRNEWGYTTGFLHRSTDRGRTWQSIRVESERVKPRASNHTSRNVLELADGTLLLGVDYDGGGGPYFVWRSTDGGETWDRTRRCEPKDFKSIYGFFGGETWLWQARSGKIWALARVDSNEMPIRGRPIQAGSDQSDHFILFSSADDGKTFDRIRDLGDYGEMYMSLLRLRDRRLLLTFTVRDLQPPLGVRAVPGMETEDGFDFDPTRDRIPLDTRTPAGTPQGGGFGPTVQLGDGTLVTSYSYRGEDKRTHLEVVRWKLPAAARLPDAPRRASARLLSQRPLARGSAEQGLALTEKEYFTSTARTICRYDSEWNLLEEKPIRIEGVNHLGAIHHHNGFLWAGLLNGPEGDRYDPKKDRGVIARIRARDLTVVQTWDITRELSWIDPVCFDGRYLWVGDLRDLGIHRYRFDRDRLVHDGVLRYPRAMHFSQGIRVVGRKLYTIHTFGTMKGLFEFRIPDRLTEEVRYATRVWPIQETRMHLEGFDFVPGRADRIWHAQGNQVDLYELGR